MKATITVPAARAIWRVTELTGAGESIGRDYNRVEPCYIIIMDEKYPRYIVWSTDAINQTDPFQKRWLLRQVLLYGRAEDIRKLDFREVKHELNALHLPKHIDLLWRNYLEQRYGSIEPD
jgi:hypothetical protein